MTSSEQSLNGFFSLIFYDVLRLEGEWISKGPYKNLSVNEMHVLDAVAQGGRPETMSELAARLKITASTLTVAVKTLEQKGYLVRIRDTADKRKVLVHLTHIAREALKVHEAFHEQLVQSVTRQFQPEQLDALTSTLSFLHEYLCSIGPTSNQ